VHDDDPEQPPGDVSNQMPEEQPEGDDLNRRDPDTAEEEHEGGEAGEGSQSTGHPEGAG
jgi:hypothetical protein